MGKYSVNFRHDPNVILPFYFIPELMPEEEFKLITDQAAPGILPYYAVSNYGRIYHVYENHFISTSWDGPGYRIAVLKFKDGRAHTCRVHRLVMMMHRYKEGCENLMVNHKNGCKTQNYIDFPGIEDPDNLEWCTASENIRHADRIGLRHPAKGKKNGMCGMSKFTEEDVRAVCEMLEVGNLTHKQIAQITGTNVGFVENLKYGRNWTHITSEYNFKFPGR